MKLRVGLIGLGEVWEQRHRTALRALADRFELRAVFDQVAHRAEQAAAEFQAVCVDSFRELIAREDIDAVLMLSNQWHGALPILAACDCGKAVYCASSLDLPPELARQVKQRVEATGVAFMAEFPRRHAAATVRLKELIATELGNPRLLFCHQRAPKPSRANHCSGLPSQSPASRDLIELVDWCCYVVGREPTAVTGVLHKRDGTEEYDYQMMSLDFSEPGQPGTGTIAQVSCGSYIPARWTEAISYRPLAALQASCERGVAFLDMPSTLIWFDEAGRHQESLDSERPAGEQCLMQFYRAVTSLVRKAADFDDAYRALSIVQQAQRSQVEGRRIALGGG